LKLALPIFEAAADEDNQELQDLWARLLAAAMDPKRRDLVRQSFIPIVKQMEAFDVAVLKIIADNHIYSPNQNGRDVVVTSLQGDPPQDIRNDVLVSFEALAKLGCISFLEAPGVLGAQAKDNPYMTPFGTLLMRAVSG
jgi:hypothetical protein